MPKLEYLNLPEVIDRQAREKLGIILATETINRMIDLFPPHERGQVRTMLTGTLKGIVGQRLVQTNDGEGRATAWRP